MKITRNQQYNEEDEIGLLEYDGLENLAGFICHKLRHDVLNIRVSPENNTKHTWINHLSEGGLSKPTEEMMEYIKRLEFIFNNSNGDEQLEPGENFLGQLIGLAEDIPCDMKIKKLFLRARMYFRMRNLNRKIIEYSKSKKRKYIKIIT